MCLCARVYARVSVCVSMSVCQARVLAMVFGRTRNSPTNRRTKCVSICVSLRFCLCRAFDRVLCMWYTLSRSLVLSRFLFLSFARALSLSYLCALTHLHIHNGLLIFCPPSPPPQHTTVRRRRGFGTGCLAPPHHHVL